MIILLHEQEVMCLTDKNQLKLLLRKICLRRNIINKECYFNSY